MCMCQCHALVVLDQTKEAAGHVQYISSKVQYVILSEGNICCNTASVSPSFSHQDLCSLSHCSCQAPSNWMGSAYESTPLGPSTVSGFPEGLLLGSILNRLMVCNCKQQWLPSNYSCKGLLEGPLDTSCTWF